MSTDGKEQLVQLWIEDAEFREEFRADPLGSVESAGLDVGDDMIASLRDLPAGLTDEQLQERISKGAFGFGGTRCS